MKKILTCVPDLHDLAKSEEHIFFRKIIPENVQSIFMFTLLEVKEHLTLNNEIDIEIYSKLLAFLRKSKTITINCVRHPGRHINSRRKSIVCDTLGLLASCDQNPYIRAGHYELIRFL